MVATCKLRNALKHPLNSLPGASAIEDHGKVVVIQIALPPLRSFCALYNILYRNNPYALALARKTAQEYADLDGLLLPLADSTGVEILLGTWIDDAIPCAIVCKTGEKTGKYIPTVLISILITFALIYSAITECPTTPELRYCGTSSCCLTVLLYLRLFLILNFS